MIAVGASCTAVPSGRVNACRVGRCRVVGERPPRPAAWCRACRAAVRFGRSRYGRVLNYCLLGSRVTRSTRSSSYLFDYYLLKLRVTRRRSSVRHPKLIWVRSMAMLIHVP